MQPKLEKEKENSSLVDLAAAPNAALVVLHVM